jgi:hypothetical protein
MIGDVQRMRALFSSAAFRAALLAAAATSLACASESAPMNDPSARPDDEPRDASSDVEEVNVELDAGEARRDAAGPRGTADASVSRRDGGSARPAVRDGAADASKSADAGSNTPPKDDASGPVNGGSLDASSGPDEPPPGSTVTIVPDSSWNCGFPEGLPPPELGKPVFEATLELGTIHDVGETQFGKRTLIEVRGGSFTGERLRGTFLERGLDWQLELATGAVEVEGVDILRTSDGSHIYTRICGVSPAGSGSARVVFDFEAPNGSSGAFLNQGKYVGERQFDAAGKKLSYRVFDVAGVTAPGDKVQVMEPDGVPDQSYDCQPGRDTKGSEVYMATVNIGGSVRVGASKRGSRNIIPITGGTMSGRIAGKVLSGGADYQLSGGSGGLNLDARYTLQTSDGELILVRNCGPASALVPVYETAKGGKAAWINEGPWLSSTPGISIGAVILTTYEAR